MTDVWRNSDGSIELRLGRWQDVLGDVECDAVIVDPPYGARTHAGHDGMMARLEHRGAHGVCERRQISYDHWAPHDVAEFCESWSPRASGWMACMTSHDLLPAWHGSMEDLGRYVFAPVPAVMRGMTVRLGGDGPSSWTVYCVVSRPKTREFSNWGTLPGAYVGGPGERVHIGGKPLWLMRELVKDYTRPGGLICDPCAGAGTTLLAAMMEGRRAIGCEVDPETFEIARRRLMGLAPKADPHQVELFA